MNRQHITASEEEMGAAHKKYYGYKNQIFANKGLWDIVTKNDNNMSVKEIIRWINSVAFEPYSVPLIESKADWLYVLAIMTQEEWEEFID